MKIFGKKIGRKKWIVCRTIWPYPEGYGTMIENTLTGERTLVDMGLSREDAEQIVKEENAKYK